MKPVMQWAVQEGDGASVRDILEHMRALGSDGDGRIFVNGRRAELDEPVEPGDTVELYPQRPPPGDEVRILAQRDGVLLADKPAGLPTETTRLGEDSLVTALLSELNGGHVHAASRLDVWVSGITLCTLGRDAAQRVQTWRDAGQVQRTYIAIAHGTLSDDAGVWDSPLGRTRDRGGRHLASTKAPELRPARTRFCVRARTEQAVLLDLHPETGRMHQLRAHAAHAEVPFYGDRLYGGPVRLTEASGRVSAIERIALHARFVELPGLSAEAPIPQSLRALWSALGGSDLDWNPQSAST